MGPVLDFLELKVWRVRGQATPAMLTRPPPAPRTRTTGQAPRGAQVRPFGGLSPWPASSSKQWRMSGIPGKGALALTSGLFNTLSRSFFRPLLPSLTYICVPQATYPLYGIAWIERRIAQVLNRFPVAGYVGRTL